MSTLARSETIEQRNRIFSALAVRNRIVEMLRFAVPAAGIVIFGGLVLQLYLASLGDDFGFSNISIDRNNLVVDAPSYSSTGTDGSSYQVAAASARSALDRTDVIDLTKAVLTVGKAGGAAMTVKADAARLETTGLVVTVEGVTTIADSTGMHGTILDVVADMETETMVGRGAVDITFANGARLEAANMSYDAADVTWRFAGVTLTLASTPGESPAAASGGFVARLESSPAVEAGGMPALQAPQPAPRRPLALESP